jgi:dTDP-glucose pyrophosphorylase
MRKVNLIPMAGEGQRFIDLGYTTPKPLIEIDKIPMVVRAAKSLPEADQWIFICRYNHIKNYNIDKVLIDYFPGALILSVNKLTDGQASTCLLAREHLFPDDRLTIGACDNTMVYSKEDYNEKIERNDALIWTFRNNPSVLRNPNMYGWVQVDPSGKANRVSCKIPISDQPMNDHAVVGAFSFKRAEDFLESADTMINKNRRVSNEFYLDVVMDEYLLKGYNIIPLEVDDYTCWGTPVDLEKYMEKENE